MPNLCRFNLKESWTTEVWKAKWCFQFFALLKPSSNECFSNLDCKCGHLQQTLTVCAAPSTVSCQWSSSPTSADVDQTEPAVPHWPRAESNSSSAGLSLQGSTTAPFVGDSAAAEVTHRRDRGCPPPPDAHTHTHTQTHPPHHRTLTQQWCPSGPFTLAASVKKLRAATHKKTPLTICKRWEEGPDGEGTVSERQEVMDGWMVFRRKGYSHYVASSSDGTAAVTASWWPKWPGKQGVAHTAVVTVVISHSVINAHNQRCLRVCVRTHTHMHLCVSVYVWTPVQGFACLLQPNSE